MKEIKNNKKGFTLIELLVVVLIIGVLAAIALPQYKLAVGKSKFSTLKNITRSLTESAQRYYLINNVYPKKVTDLDIEFDLKREINVSYGIQFETYNGINCTVWNENNQNRVACIKTIFGNDIAFYMNRDLVKPMSCIAFSTNVNDFINRLCKNETGKTGKLTNSSYYIYLY